MKQYLIYAGLFLASFLVINVGMYFFLSATQPSPQVALDAAADSSGALVDSSTALLPAHTDSTSAATPEVNPESHAQLVEALGGEASGAIDTTISEQITEPMPQEPLAEESLTEIQQPETDSIASMANYDESYEEEAIEPAEISQPAIQPNPKELAKLAKLLEGMKPAEAAAIASRLGTEEIVALVMKMKDRKAAKMMAELPVEQAARVAERMSEIITQQGVKS